MTPSTFQYKSGNDLRFLYSGYIVLINEQDPLSVHIFAAVEFSGELVEFVTTIKIDSKEGIVPAIVEAKRFIDSYIANS